MRKAMSLARLLALSVLAWLAPQAWAQADATPSATVPVTVDNFVRAESHRYMNLIVRQGGFAKLLRRTELAPVDKPVIGRVNRDTLYSSGVFDLDAGPVTITLPDAGQRFRSLVAIDEDEYTPAAMYAAGSYTFTRESVGTRYVLLGMRTFYDPSDERDRLQAVALQEAVQVRQASPGKFEIPHWDAASQKKVREALLALGSTIPDSHGMFGTRDQVSSVHHLIGAAAAWGGNHEKDAFYLNVTPALNDGRTVHRMRIQDVPVDAFWSVSVYDAEGWFRANARNAYTLNNLTARRSADGTVELQFGDCDGKAPNCLPIVAGWNYMVRLYRPRPQVLDGRWVFPTAQPVAGASER